VKALNVILCVVAFVVSGFGAHAAVNSLRDGEPSRADLVGFQGDDYSVDLPDEPERGVLSIPSEDGDLKLVYYFVVRGSSIMGVAASGAPRGERPDLKGAIVGTAPMTGGTLEDESAATHRGLRACDARISGVLAEDGKTEGTLFVRVIANGRRMYQLQYIVAGGDRTSAPEVYDAFVESFRVRPDS
jgi:hypothetical protein